MITNPYSQGVQFSASGCTQVQFCAPVHHILRSLIDNSIHILPIMPWQLTLALCAAAPLIIDAVRTPNRIVCFVRARASARLCACVFVGKR